MARQAQDSEHLRAMLSQRDRAVLADLGRVRLLTGRQLERLHFAELATPNVRGSARRRSLGRLVTQRWVTTLPRRVGGERAGSSGLVYALDSRAHRERLLWDDQAGGQRAGGRARRPWAIGWLFVAHTLDIAELYVQLREAERRDELTVLAFDAEPASWFNTGNESSPLKPDAHVVVEANGWERHWWVEVDRATESLPTLRRKLARYIYLYRSGGVVGPNGVLPRVLVTTPHGRRVAQAQALIQELLGGDQAFIRVVAFDDAVSVLAGEHARPPP